MYLTIATGNLSTFKQRLQSRLRELSEEAGQSEFVMPVGLFLLLDEKNGGDTTAQELMRRFHFLDLESRNLVDFYFLGWSLTDPRDPGSDIAFKLNEFEVFRTALRNSGVKDFGGNADLILVDARYKDGVATLDFSQAIRLDMSVRKEEGVFSTVGDFLRLVIDSVESLKSRHQSGDVQGGFVFDLSDKLGLAIAKKSILGWFLEKWGSVIGAKKLEAVAVRNLGPRVPLTELD